MKQIEVNMIAAVKGRYNFRSGNTEVIVNGNEITVKLFGNTICIEKGGIRYYQNCGWSTITTRSRLNALGANVRIKNGCMEFCEEAVPVLAYNPYI